MFQKPLFYIMLLLFIILASCFISNHFLTARHQSISDILEPEPLFQDSPDKYYCINGNDPQNLSPKQQLQEFIQGPCSPMIIIPGILGTSLMVEIDCETLKSESPGVFSTCGWETCSSWQFWRSKPAKEYKLWLTDIISPLSMFSLLENTHTCFSSLIKINFNVNATRDEERYQSPKGVKITWYGNTDSTRESNQCGLSSIRDLTGIIHYGCDSEGFGKFIESFENLGYQNSMTLQAIPYDFRKGVLYNNFEKILKRTLRFMFELTGKKVSIIAHSMGNNYVLHALNNMLQEEKDQLIFEYILIGAPLSGTLNALQTELSGFKEFQLFGRIGLDFEAQKSFLSSPSLFECLPYDAFERFRGEVWMQDILTRMDQEKKFQFDTEEGKAFWSKEDFNLKWFPSPLKNCGNSLEKEKKCSPNFVDFFQDPMVKILNQSYYGTHDDMLKLMEKYFAMGDKPLLIYNEILKNKLHLLENPKVPMTIIYSSLLNTSKQIRYLINPKEQTVKKNDFFWDEEIEFGKGDGNILGSSILVPASKWIWEHQKKVDNAKSIKVVEICSNYQNFLNENLQENSSFYSGYDCKCLDTQNINNCKHTCLISEDGVINLVFNVIKRHPKVENMAMPLINYENLEDKCFALNLPLEVENIINFLKNS